MKMKSVRIPEEILTSLEKYKSKHGKSFQFIFEEALVEFFKKNK